MKKRFVISTLSLISITFGSSSIVLLSSCSNNNQIIWANFESYMSPYVMDEAQANHNVKFQVYSNNEDILNKFENYYDLATPSTYTVIELYERDLLAEIDWNKLTNGIYKTADEALNLFSDSVQKAVTSYDIDGDGKNDNLLKYGIPYFLQDYVFAYKGSAISSCNNATSWKEECQAISNEERFQNDGRPKLTMVDDGRNLYSLSRLIETDNKTINPPIDHTPTYEEIIQTYESFTQYFSKDTFWLNSDSGQVLLSLSDPNGSNGGIMFNGDAMYAALGADTYDPYNNENFHVVKPNTFIALDMVVFNKKSVNGNSNKVDEIYDLAREILLGMNSEGIFIDIDEINDDDEYNNLAMANFDFVLYTSPLKNIDEYVLSNNEDNYFNTRYELDGDESMINLYKDIYRVDISNLFIEAPISDLLKSNMHWAYNKIKTWI